MKSTLQSLESSLTDTNARLWAEKDKLRKIEGAIQDCQLTVDAGHAAEYTQSDYLFMIKELSAEADNIRRDIAVYEADRDEIKKLISMYASVD